MTDAEKVLGALERAPRPLSSAELGQGIPLGAHRLYPALMALEQRGKVQSQWDPPEPRADGGPRQRVYWLAR